MKERFAQLRSAFAATRQHDDKLVPILAAAMGVTFAAVLALGFLIGQPILGAVLAIMLSLLAGLIVFGRRTQAAQYGMIEGQPGAAAAVLNTMRGQWFVTPAVAFNKKQDLVHRVVGRCGVVLVAEGSSSARVKQLVAQERKKLKRVVGDAPLNTIVVGDGEGETPLDRLQFSLTKLPRELSKTEVPKLDRKLAPLDKGMPVPQGYMPRPGKKMR